MSKTPNYDMAVKTILDQLIPEECTCSLTGETWNMTAEEIGWYKKFNVPPSKQSPMTRMRLVNSNFVLFDVWYNYHAETGKPVVSVIHPASGVRVLPDEEWFQKDFTSLGREIDIYQPFFPLFFQALNYTKKEGRQYSRDESRFSTGKKIQEFVRVTRLAS